LSPKQQSTHLEKLRVKAELAKAMVAAVEATGSISCDKRGALATPSPSPKPHFDALNTLQPICSRRQKGDEKLEHPATRVLLPKEVLRSNTYTRFKKNLFDV
jgi:hypothetical protein